MTELVASIETKAVDCMTAMPCEDPPDAPWILWIISDHEAYWIHTKTDTVVASSRNY